MRLFYVCLHTLPNKEKHERQYSDQHNRAINVLFAKGNSPLNWGVRGLVRLVVMNIHISLQAVRFFELGTGLEEAPKSIQ